MARTRTIKTRDDGSLFYEIKRSRTIDVPGTKGLTVKENVEVPQLSEEGELDEILQNALNFFDGKDDAERVSKFVEVVNAGLVAEANTSVNARLSKKINESAVVSDYADIVKLTKTMFPDMEAGARGEMILERFPEIAKKLSEAGLEPGADSEEDDDSDDE